MNKTLRLGLDVGSTTVKAVVLDDGQMVFSDYRRHNADVRGELQRLLADVQAGFPDDAFEVAMTGSGGLSVAKIMGVSFIQEVVASTTAIERFFPQADVVIELGGEDAKLTYLHPVPEQRMNGTCAGGTGAFIDQMATLLKTDAGGLDELASRYTNLYPIASRCGVFAKTDVQPLLNQGAAHEDIAASVFQAVATQTIAGLACGHPIRGNVIFLGGPLYFLPQLREAFKRALGDRVSEYISPNDAQLFVALGAAISTTGPALSLPHIGANLESAKGGEFGIKMMRPLFATPEERADFDRRHGAEVIEMASLADATGGLFLGLDAGSTTIKSVVMDRDERILFSTYGSNEGDPIAAAVAIARQIRAALPKDAWIERSCVTGYGEALVKAAIHTDEGEIETMAHYRAAMKLAPDVTSVIDIGGQDMKFLKIRNGAVDSIAVNEACSSGCGSFLQTFAATMGIDIEEFASAGLESTAPVDLGSRCTVFMNSSVKQAQKEGAGIADISAGLSYSVVRNALYKVMKLRDSGDLGSVVVAQGGTFLNDAVLRAFELLTGVQVIRPNIAGLMGAYGAALTAKMHSGQFPSLGGVARSAGVTPPKEGNVISPFMTRDLDAFTVESEQKTCQICANRCKLTITTFDDGARNVSGNRCERGASLEKKPAKSGIPNLYDYKYERTFAYHRLAVDKAPRGVIGIPRALGMYEDYPLWFTILTKLGFSVLLSGRSNHDLFEKGMESIPAENVCYPAKLAHGHVEWLLEHGAKTIFFPAVNYELSQFEDADNNYNCPIVAYYPQVIDKNIEGLHQPGIRYMVPFVNLNNPENLAKRVAEIFADWDVTPDEAQAAVTAGYEELALFHADVKAEGDRALQFMRENKLRGIVLAGRPYHVDPEINHGIPETITKLGMVVLSEDALTVGLTSTHLERPIRVMDQWTYHSRLYEAAAQVRATPDLNLVQLNSFGCGVDAITTDQVQEIIEGAAVGADGQRPPQSIYTVIKIDEVSNLGAATIRLRSLQAATADHGVVRSGSARQQIPLLRRGGGGADGVVPETRAGSTGVPHANDASPAIPMVSADPKPPYTKEMKAAGFTIFAPQLSPVHLRMLEPIFHRAGYNVHVLEKASNEDVECGLKFVHNDACFPAIMVIGQLINAFVSGGADPDRSAVMITQTGGMCRATNYVGMLRRGLKQAGYPQVPVLALSTQGFEANPGFKITVPMITAALQAITIGDCIQNVLLRVRPYERDEGSANELYARWDSITREYFSNDHYSKTYGGKLSYKRLLKLLVREFDELPLLDIPRKPRIGVVGEILVKFQPDANNNVVGVIENEGCEAVLPGITSFLIYGMAPAQWRLDNLGVGSKKGVFGNKLAVKFIEGYAKPMVKALKSANGKFSTPESIYGILERAQHVISPGTNAGEGWFLVGEMMELIESGTPNIICCQPFACLPNHVVGRGMFGELRRQYRDANIVSIDYDPGAPEVNQLNRIKLMVATAHKNAGTQGTLARWDDEADDAKMTSLIPAS
ncbi:MAG: acyl-CoA dehydratase activase-related protein [Propionibacteriaceae bacterium]|nr:acyl-CoA dehydratase activase-related protein [Propionibacteriaceae bacterium]